MFLSSTVLDTTTFEVNVTACDLENSFILTMKLKSETICIVYFMCKHVVVESHFIYEL